MAKDNIKKILSERTSRRYGDEEIRPQKVSLWMCYAILWLTLYMLTSSWLLTIVLTKGPIAAMVKFLIFFIVKVIGLGLVVWKFQSIEDAIFLFIYKLVSFTGILKGVTLIIISFLILCIVVYIQYDFMTNPLEVIGLKDAISYVINNDVMSFNDLVN